MRGNRAFWAKSRIAMINPVRRPRLQTAFFIMVLVPFILMSFFNLSRPSRIPVSIARNTVQCIKITQYGQSREGIGALLRRNQLAFFLADTFNARLDFPSISSEHGYEVSNIFDRCPDASPNCQLNQSVAVIGRCPLANCDCHLEKVAPYIKHMATSCQTLLIQNDKQRTQEYSGCMRKTVTRYLGSTEKEPVDFDVVHFRAGDLSHASGGKAHSKVEKYFILLQMCRLSNRDIIILTEGRPPIPDIEECNGRLVLASDTSIHDAFRIFQHAKHVGVGQSSFALAMMEVASPLRMITMQRSVMFYEWVDVEKWTVLGDKGAVFHFDSKKMMAEAMIGRESVHRSFRTMPEKLFLQEHMQMTVPSRMWVNDSNSWVQ